MEQVINRLQERFQLLTRLRVALKEAPPHFGEDRFELEGVGVIIQKGCRACNSRHPNKTHGIAHSRQAGSIERGSPCRC